MYGANIKFANARYSDCTLNKRNQKDMEVENFR